MQAEPVFGLKRRPSDLDKMEIIIEKKQRVEKLVSGLGRIEQDENHAKDEVKTGNQKRCEGVSVTTTGESSNNTTTSTTERSAERNETPPRLYTTIKDINGNLHRRMLGSKASKTPAQTRLRTLKVQTSNGEQSIPFFPVPRDNGISFNPNSPTMASIVRVPRDNKTSFLIYTPPTYKPNTKTPFTSANRFKEPSSSNVNKMKSKRNPSPPTPDAQKLSPVLTAPPTSPKFDEKPVRRSSSTLTTPSKWSPDDVYTYLLTTDCAPYAKIFLDQEIDGKALLLLDEIRIANLLGVKMGPAIKISALIKSLQNS